MAYLPANADLHDYWPEASHVEVEDSDGPRFSDRFPKPDWYEGVSG